MWPAREPHTSRVKRPEPSGTEEVDPETTDQEVGCNHRRIPVGLRESLAEQDHEEGRARKEGSPIGQDAAPAPAIIRSGSRNPVPNDDDRSDRLGVEELAIDS